MAISISRSGGNIYDAASAILRARAAGGSGGGSGGSSGGGSSGGSSGGSGGSGSSGGSGLTQDERDALKRQQKLEDDARNRQQKLEDDARNRQQDLEDDARTRQQKLEDAAQKREDDARRQEAEDKAYAKKYGDDALRDAQEQRYKAEDDARRQEAEDKAYAKKYGDDALRAAQERRYEIEDDARRQAAEDKAYAKKYGDESLRDAQEQKYKIEDDERKREDEALKRKYKEADDALKREDEALAQKKKREDAAQEQKYKIEDDARAQASKDREYAKKYGNEALADAQKQRYKIEDDARQQANQEKNTAADQANKIANAAQDQANNERNAAIDAGNDAQQAAQAAANASALAGQRAAASAGNAAQQQMYNKENALRQQGYRSWNDRQKNAYTDERDARKEQKRLERDERAQKYKIEILGINDANQQLNDTQRASLRSYEKWQDRVDEAYDNGFVYTPDEQKALLEEEIAFNQDLEDPRYDDEGVRQAMRREFQQKRAAKVPTTRVTTPGNSRMTENGITYVHKNGNWEIEENPNVALADKTRLQDEKDKENRRKQAKERQDAINKAEEFYRSRTQKDDETKLLYTEENVQRLARKRVKESEKDLYPDLPPIPDDPTTTPLATPQVAAPIPNNNNGDSNVTRVEDDRAVEEANLLRDQQAAKGQPYGYNGYKLPDDESGQLDSDRALDKKVRNGILTEEEANRLRDHNPRGGTPPPLRGDYKSNDDWRNAYDKWTGSSNGQSTALGQATTQAPVAPQQQPDGRYDNLTPQHSINDGPLPQGLTVPPNSQRPYIPARDGAGTNVLGGVNPQTQDPPAPLTQGVSPIDVSDTVATGQTSILPQQPTITPSSKNIGDYFNAATDSGDTEGAAAFQTIQSISANGIPPEGSDNEKALSEAYRVLASKGLKIGAKNK